MGRPGASKRLKKAEKAKIQLKGYATKFLPKGKNVTDTMFKVRKIVLQDQIKSHDQTEALTRRKLSIKEVLSRLQHYSSTQRLEGLSGLLELLHHMDKKQLVANLLNIIDNLGKLSLDVESRVRRSAARVLSTLLIKVDEVELSPFSAILGSYISCAMTHIKPGVQEDSLLILDALLKFAPSLIAFSASQFLSCSLDMISRLKDGKGVNRQLSLNLSSSQTSSAWRASVLGRLQALLNVSMTHLSKKKSKDKGAPMLYLTEDAFRRIHFPLLNSHYSASACVSQALHLNIASKNCHEPLEESKQMKTYTESFLPLLLDSWLEVCPTSKSIKEARAEDELSLEAAIILHSVLEVKYLLLQHLILFDDKNGTCDLIDWFKQTYTKDLSQYFTTGFPYVPQTNFESGSEDESSGLKHRPEVGQDDIRNALALFNLASEHVSLPKNDSSACDGVVKCMPQNLRLCYIFAYVFKSPPHHLKEKILSFLTTCLNDWDASCAYWSDHLLLALETTLRCSHIWSCNMNPLLSALVGRYKKSASKKSQTHRLFAHSLNNLLGSMVLSKNFPQFQRYESLCSWLFELPSSLNHLSLSEETLHMYNKLAAQRNVQFLHGLQAAVPSVLSALQISLAKFPDSCEVGIGLVSLLYRVPHWTEESTQYLGEFLLKNSSFSLTRKLVNILSLRRDDCPALKNATWWDEVLTS